MSKLGDIFRGLSPRDQRALGLLGLVLLLFLGFLTVRGVNQARSRSNVALTNRKAELKKVIALAARYQEAIGDKEAFKARIKRTRISLASLLEDAGRQNQIEISDMKNQSPAKTEGAKLAEERIRVTIKSITMDQFAHFIDTLMQRGRGDLIRVRELSLKTQFEDREMINAVFVVSTWKEAS
ncbi:MAG: hypothetical protein CMH55_01275 [Myxococcales bacterium]|nr:hypothetical protein [Myxococcales bacterium]|tara:strand:- start:1145 stop:1690 length:546 start_codon:yes stop_codon:yes gene_type:complete